MAKKFLVFTYGTLKTGHYNNYRFQKEGCRLVGTAKTAPQYHLYDKGGYPLMTEAKVNGGCSIEGEIWEITPDVLEGCDNLELAFGYERKQVALLSNDNADLKDKTVLGYLFKDKERAKVYPECSPVWPPKRTKK